MSKILELRNKRNTLWEQTKNFLEEHRDENGLVAAEFVDQYDLCSLLNNLPKSKYNYRRYIKAI